MRAVRFHEFGGPEVLQVDEIERPSAGVGELLVEVRAVGANPSATYARSDWEEYVPAKLPSIPGADFAGVVEAVGEGVTRFDVGDRVFGVVGWKGPGTYAEYIAVPADRTAALPDTVGYEQGAGVGNAGGPAWHALTGKARLAPGKTCLVHGGSGGVGHIASQLAAAAGMTVIATAGADDRVDRLTEFGVDVALNYHRDDLSEAIARGAPEGVDVVLDHFPHLYLDLDIEVAARDATITIYDKTDLATANVHAGRGKNLTIWLTSFGAADKGAVMRHLARLLASGDLQVEIARRYTFDEAAEVHRAVEEDHYVGRLIVTP